MKRILAIMISLSLVACGSNEPMTRKGVPCEQSRECMTRVAANEFIATCGESFMGQPAIMMSTWDNGKTWSVGNCDATAK